MVMFRFPAGNKYGRGAPKKAAHLLHSRMQLSMDAEMTARIDRVVHAMKLPSRQAFIKLVVKKELASWERT